MTIGENIRSLGIEKNMSQTKLAELLFTSQDTISLWELGKSFPDIQSVIKMTEIFDVSSDFLLCIEK